MARDDEKFDFHRSLGQFVSFLAALPVLGVAVVLSGLVLYKYWGWFVLPAFPTLPAPSILHFIGLRMFVGAVTMKTEAPRRKTAEEKREAELRTPGTWEQLLFSLWMYGLFLLFGWLIHLALSIDWYWANKILGM